MKKQKFNNYFGSTLKEVRIEKSLTQEGASKVSGISQKRWSSYEVGRCRPNLDLIIIAIALEISPFELINRALSNQGPFVDYSSENFKKFCD